MKRPAHDTKRGILEAAYGLFYREGFARVSVDSIAAAAGVTKRTVYYHFDSKDALVGAVLAHQHDYALGRIQGWAETSSDDPWAMIDEVFARLERWASEPKWLGSGFTRITMELADLPGHPARAAARQHKAAIENWLAARLADMGVDAPRETARRIKLLLEGCLSLILIHGDTRYATSAAAAAKALVTRNRLKQRRSA
jgi:AcrR family transcriptional regulator